MDLTDDSRPVLRVLGTLSLEANGAEVLVGRRKPLLFLAFVACHGARGVSRAGAMEVFWGDRAEARARQSVRQALLLLRTELGDALEVDRNRIRVRAEGLRVDVLELGVTLEGYLATPSTSLRLLPGEEEGAPRALQDWLDAERATLERKIRSWCREQMEEAAARADHGRMASLARLWSEAAPLDVAPMEATLEALPLLGRTAEALEAWARWSAGYVAMLGEAPPDSLVRRVGALELGMVQEKLPSSGSAAPARGEDDAGRGPDALERAGVGARSSPLQGPGSLALFSPDLVERQVVRTRLRTALEAVRQGEGRVLALTGPEGIGKSRLLREFLREVAAREEEAVLTLSTEPLAPEEESALGAVRALLRPLSEAPGLGGASETALALVAELVPEVRGRFRTLPKAEAGTPAQLGQAVASVLSVVGEEVSILLAVDDVPDLDPESRQVLAELLRAPPGGVMLLVTSEEDPTRSGTGLLGGTGHLERIELPPLSASGVAVILRSMMTPDPGIVEPLARQLHASAAGNPLLVVAMVHALADAQALVPGPDGIWRLGQGAPDGVLPSLEDLPTTLAPRWTQLPSPLRRILEALAVLGGPSPPARLGQVAGLEPAAFDDAVDALLVRRLIREVRNPEGPAHLDFPHTYFRRAAYDAVSPRRREELHGRAAATLAREAQSRPRLRPRVAEHLARSGASQEPRGAARRDGPDGNGEHAGPKRRLRVTAALVAAAILLFLGWGMRPGSAPDDLVAIFPFETRIDADQAWLGVGVADLLAAGLDGVGGVRTVDRHALSAVLPGGEVSAPAARRLARRLGAGSWVLGQVLEIDDDVVLQASLYSGRGRVERFTSERTPATAMVGEVDRLARLLLPSLVAGDELPRLDLATRTTGSMGALRAFVEGEAAFRAGRYEAAIEAYEVAIGLDPEFALAHLRTALALEWSGNATASRISASLASAEATRSRLPAKERRLLGAMIRYHRGLHLEAVAELRELLAEEPDFVDGWFALAEVLFHTLPRTGNPDALAEAHRILQQVLTLSPNHREALLHLPRTALHLGDAEAADAAMRRLRETELVDRPIFVTSEALVAWARGEEEAMDRLRGVLGSAPPLLSLVAGSFLSVYAQRADLAAELTRGLDHPLRTGEVRGTGQLWTSVFLRRAGDQEGSDLALGEAARWLPDQALRLEALFLVDPGPGRPSAEAAHLREAAHVPEAARRGEVLRRLEAGSGVGTPRAPALASAGLTLPWPSSPAWTPDASAALDAYLTGLLHAMDGEMGEARRRLEILERRAEAMARATDDAGESEEAELVQALRHGLAADLLRKEGRLDEALQELRAVRLGGWHQLAFSSPYFALPRERALLGLLLEETGAADEADRWTRSLKSATPFDGIWPAPR